MLVQQEDVYSNFIDSIKSEVTKKIYSYNSRLFMEYCGIEKYDDFGNKIDEAQPLIYHKMLDSRK